MSLTMPERIATLEEQNEACAKEREDLRTDVNHIKSTLDQIKGSVRTLVILWTIAVAVAGFVGVKHVTTAPASAAAHP
jgi:hypothetical protein